MESHRWLARAQSAHRLPLALGVLLAFAACSGDDSPEPTTDTPGAAVPTGGTPGGGAAAGGGASGADAGSSGVGGTSSTTDAGSSSPGASMAGAGGRTAGGGLDASVATSDAGSTPRTDGGGATSGTGSADGGSAGGGAGGCTRELLQSTIDQYFKALAAHNPMMLPLADNVKFTEDGMMMPLGMGGMWMTAGMMKYEHSALDVETCSTVSEAVVPDGTRDIPYGLRLKLVGGKITEIETIAVQAGDYKVFGSDFPSNTGAISRSATVVKWADPVPEGMRNTRAEIEKWLNKYFRSFPAGGCNLASNCQRLENGGGNFECSAALSCGTAEPSATGGTLRPRLFVIDVERGIGVGFVMFMGHTDFHMIKMYGGQIYAVHAILAAAMNPGW